MESRLLPLSCLCVACGVLLAAAPAAVAEQRLGYITVTVDDVLFLVGDFEFQDTDPPAKIWSNLVGLPLFPNIPQPVAAVGAVGSLGPPMGLRPFVAASLFVGGMSRPLESDPETEKSIRIVVKGKIKIAVQNVGEFTVSELHLNHGDEADDFWHIDIEQLESLGEERGFPPLTPQPSRDVVPEVQARRPFPWPLVIIGVIVFLVAGGGLVLYRRAGARKHAETKPGDGPAPS